MIRTVYSAMASNDLVEFALQRDNATQLEIEFAQRLQIALVMLEDEDGANTRSKGEESGKRATG
jgi:hypothetical protein